MKNNMKLRILEIMEDGEWKYPSDLLEAGTSYTQCINKMRREQGYIIEDEWVGDRGGPKKYRYIGREEETKESRLADPHS